MEPTLEEMRQMVIDIMEGRIVRDKDPDHAEARKILTEEIREIEDKGGMVDFPFEV